MKNIGRLFILTGLVFLLVGMAFGLKMAATMDFTLHGLHAHLSLLGFVLMIPLAVRSNNWSIRNLESQLVGKVLERTDWNISRAASLLGINRTTLYNKIRQYELGERPQRSSLGA